MRFMITVSNSESRRGTGMFFILFSAFCSPSNKTFERWADVPTTKHTNLFVSSSGCSHGPPTVKYRGIFLNDEQPALQNWAMEKFTNGTGSFYFNSPFNSQFYAKL